jgi:ferredoxin-NADP reductase
MSKSSSFITKLRDRREVAKGTMAFQFERPSELAFKAGQYLNLILIDPPETDAEGNERSFSIVSAPHERHLMIATRMRDTAFKRVLKTAPIETQVKIEAPFGNLTLHDDPTRPAVLLSGGIGKPSCCPVESASLLFAA